MTTTVQLLTATAAKILSIISDKAAVNPASDDLLLIQDTSGANALKKSTIQQILDSNAYVQKTGAYTLTLLDSTVEWTTGTVDGTLPTAVGCTGKIFRLKNRGGGVITILTTSSQTIDSSASGAITLVTNALLIVQSNGSNWIRLN